MAEIPVKKMPLTLSETIAEYPEVKAYNATPENQGLEGRLRYMQYGAVMMFELGKFLWPDGKKFRVTIECDPERGDFVAKREEIT